MYQYDKLVECFESKGCHLLVSKEEFEANRQSTKIPKLKYIASCGHEHEVHVNVFKSRDTGIVCPSCKSKAIAIKKRGDATRTSEGQSLFSAYEDQCLHYLKDILTSFESIKTNDGCLADMAIKPVGVEEDQWMPVQIKTTQLNETGYSFNCTDKYDGMLIICMCWTDKKMWFFDGSLMKHTKISIGKHNSKYEDNFVEHGRLQEITLKYYNKLPKVPLEQLMIPLSTNQQTEHDFRKLRETRIDFLSITYPEKSNLVYDFMLNGKKVQEKVCSLKRRGGNGIVVGLFKNGGKFNTEVEYTPSGRNKISYEKGDNDLYWLHMPDKQYFYVLPEAFLIQESLVVVENCKEKKHTIWIPMDDNARPNKQGWDKYLFDYKSIDKERLMKLIE
jgi:DNA-directed RNA polymerase subunit RPC12/RpoP